MPDTDTRSQFIRSITGTAGTAILASGREVRGWVSLESGDDHVYMILAETGDTPTCGRDLDAERIGVEETGSRSIILRVAHVAVWEYAGEDEWA